MQSFALVACPSFERWPDDHYNPVKESLGDRCVSPGFRRAPSLGIYRASEDTWSVTRPGDINHLDHPGKNVLLLRRSIDYAQFFFRVDDTRRLYYKRMTLQECRLPLAQGSLFGRLDGRLYRQINATGVIGWHRYDLEVHSKKRNEAAVL